MADIIFFKSQDEFSDWLEEHSETNEIWVGYFRKSTGRASLTWSTSVDVALCFGWIVTLSSIADKGAEIDYENLKLEKPFNKFREYGQSKVADLIFALELQRKISKNNLDILSVACHPGVSKTELLRYDVPEMIETVDYMNANQGAFPTLFAATEELIATSSSNNYFYFGPDGKNEINGYPAPAFIEPYANNELVGNKLWNYAEKETGVKFNFES
uniref:Short-chain dehydrogenase n=1 Tax=OCS116 cluster bacterium TaxID=2030921 RepID=A0A2A4Z0B6_9PROT